MASYSYSLLQYVPDPVRNERINVGVLLVGEDENEPFFNGRILNKPAWGRLRRLGYDHDFEFLADLQRDMAARVIGPDELPKVNPDAWTIDQLLEISRSWAGTIQATAPRPVVHTSKPMALLADLYGRYVADPAPTKKRARDRRYVNNRIRTGLKSVVSELQPSLNLASYLFSRPKVNGRLDAHQFDFMIKNGKPLELMKSLSLEVDPAKARTEIDAIAWSISDVRSVSSDLPIAVVSIGGEKRLRDSAAHIYGELGAEFVREPEIDAWLAGSAQRLLLAAGASPKDSKSEAAVT